MNFSSKSFELLTDVVDHFVAFQVEIWLVPSTSPTFAAVQWFGTLRMSASST